MTNQTLNEFFRAVYRPLRLRGRSPNTVRLYTNLFRQMGKHFGRPPMLSDLTDLAVAGYLQWRSDAGRSPWTVERERNQLLALGRFAAARRLIDIAPDVPAGPLPRNIPHAWQLNELRRLLHAADNTPGMIGDTPAGIWWGSFLHAMYETSERVSALIMAPRYGFTGKTLLIPALARKGGERPRIYRISERTSQRIVAVLRTHNKSLIWPWPYSHTYLWGRMGKIVSRAGLNPKHMKFHAMRRSAASHFAAAGGDASRFLGHSHPRITEEFYLDPRIVTTGPQPCDILPEIR